jgi:hypothetical protein
MSRFRLRLVAGFVALAPLLFSFSFSGRAPGAFVAPATACTGGPVFAPEAVITLPPDGAVVPRNARVLFVPGQSFSMFGSRPTSPVSVRQISGANAAREVAVLEGSEERFEPNAAYEVWLPTTVTVPVHGKVAMGRVATFRVSDAIDNTPPRLERRGELVLHPAGPTSCGPPPRVEIPVAIHDESPAFVEIAWAASEPPLRAPVVNGRVWYTMSLATHLALTPVDIAGNRGEALLIDLHRLPDGGAPTEPHEPSASMAEPRRGCGKY